MLTKFGLFIHAIIIAMSLSTSQKVWSMGNDDRYELNVQHYNDSGLTYMPNALITPNLLPCTPQKRDENQCQERYDVRDEEAMPEPGGELENILIRDQDGRERILNTTIWPHSIHAHLHIKINDRSYGGSGVLVGPHHLLTCAHNVYDYNTGKYFQEISVYPALNGIEVPFGQVRVTRAYVFEKWENHGDQNFDMALLLLEKSIGYYTGWGGILTISDEELSQEKIYVTGYPGDKGLNQMWGMRNTVQSVKPEIFNYKIDTYKGQSGGAVWVNKYGGVPFILGVHTLGGRDTNSGVRISGKKLSKLSKIIQDTYCIPDRPPSPDPRVRELEETVQKLKIEKEKEAEKRREREREERRREAERREAEARRRKEERKIEEERKRIQEKAALWGCGIDQIEEHLDVLVDCCSTYQQLQEVLEKMKAYYTKESQIDIVVNQYPSLDRYNLSDNFPEDLLDYYYGISNKVKSLLPYMKTQARRDPDYQPEPEGSYRRTDLCEALRELIKKRQREYHTIRSLL